MAASNAQVFVGNAPASSRAWWDELLYGPSFRSVWPGGAAQQQLDARLLGYNRNAQRLGMMGFPSGVPSVSPFFMPHHGAVPMGGDPAYAAMIAPGVSAPGSPMQLEHPIEDTAFAPLSAGVPTAQVPPGGADYGFNIPTMADLPGWATAPIPGSAAVADAMGFDPLSGVPVGPALEATGQNLMSGVETIGRGAFEVLDPLRRMITTPIQDWTLWGGGGEAPAAAAPPTGPTEADYASASTGLADWWVGEDGRAEPQAAGFPAMPGPYAEGQAAGQEMVDKLSWDNLMDGVRLMESGGIDDPETTPNRMGPGGTPISTALGAYQILTGTAADPGYGIEPLIGPQGDQRTNAAKSRRFAYQYISKMTEKYGDVRLGILAYKWGPGNVDDYVAGKKNVPEAEWNYVDGVLRHAAAGGEGARYGGSLGVGEVDVPGGLASAGGPGGGGMPGMPFDFGQPETTEFSYELPDLMQGFPEMPEAAQEPDYSKVDALMAEAAPVPTEIDETLPLLSFLSGAALGSLRGRRTSEVLAGAGGLALQGLISANQYNDEVRRADAYESRSWKMRMAEIEASRAENREQLKAQASQQYFDYNLAKYQIATEMAMQRMPDVEVTDAGVTTSYFDEASGKMVVSHTPRNKIAEFAQRSFLSNYFSAMFRKDTTAEAEGWKPENYMIHMADAAVESFAPDDQPFAFMAGMALQNGIPAQILAESGLDIEDIRLTIEAQRSGLYEARAAEEGMTVEEWLSQVDENGMPVNMPSQQELRVFEEQLSEDERQAVGYEMLTTVMAILKQRPDIVNRFLPHMPRVNG